MDLYTDLTRYGSGIKPIPKAFVDGVDDPRLRLLPRTFGGTGVRRRKARHGYNGVVVSWLA